MLKHICKAINMTTRVIVGNTNPSITERTYALDLIMTTRHEVKKDGHLDAAADAELLGMLDLAMGREGDTATELTLEQGLALADEADVEDNTVITDASYDEWDNVVEMYEVSSKDLQTMKKNDEEVGNRTALYIAHQNAIKNGKKGKLTKKEVRDMAYYIYDALEENINLGHKESESIRTFLDANAEKSSINFMNALVVAFVNDKN